MKYIYLIFLFFLMQSCNIHRQHQNYVISQFQQEQEPVEEGVADEF